MTRAVVPADLDALVRAVGAALDGAGPPVAPVAPLARPDAAPAGTSVDAATAPGDGVALVLRTSGSTGAPREVALSAAAVRASGAATHERLGGPGHWLLTLPATHVAGVQVVARAHAAGRGLTVAPPDEPFTPAGFAALVARAPHGERRYVSLVPTQLHRLVAAADAGSADGAAGLDALCSLDAVLLGGAATPAPLLRRARAAGARVVTTYGMTETCGGCVYDGVPLAGARVRVVPADGSSGETAGVVELSGPFLADGYLGDPAATAAAFRTDRDGTRWFRTNDLGRLGGPPDAPTLAVLGRADDVLVSGGVNVAPAAVEAVLAEVEAIGEACVVGVPHPEWGQEVVAVVTLAGHRGERAPHEDAPHDGAHGDSAVAPAGLVAAVRDRVADRLGRAAAPRRVLVVADLPRRGPGKVDRAAAARIAVGHPGQDLPG